MIEAVAFVLGSHINPYGIYSDCETVFGISEFLVSSFGNLILNSKNEVSLVQELTNGFFKNLHMKC